MEEEIYFKNERDKYKGAPGMKGNSKRKAKM